MRPPIARAIALALGVTACAPTVTREGSSGSGTGTSHGPTASSGTAGTSGTGGGSPSPTQCGLQTLASGFEEYSAIAYASQFVYYASGAWFGATTSTIVRVPITGGAPETLFSSVPRLSGFDALAVNATDLYWASSDGTVRKAAIGSAETTVLFAGSCAQGSTLACPQSIALDDSSVYFGSSDGSIRRIPLAGGIPTVLLGPQGSSPFSVVGLSVDASNLVWSTAGDNKRFIKTMPLSGGAPIVLLTGPFLLGTVVHGGYAYVTDGGSGLSDGPNGPMGNGKIYQVRIDQSEATKTIATAQPYPAGIIADATGVYWGGGLGMESGDSWSVPLEHIAANTTAIETVVPNTVALNIVSCEGAICWVDAANGDLLRYAECAP